MVIYHYDFHLVIFRVKVQNSLMIRTTQTVSAVLFQNLEQLFCFLKINIGSIVPTTFGIYELPGRV